MPALTTIIAGASLAVAGGSAYAQNKQAKKSVKAQNQALALERKQADLAAMRQKRDAIRQARIAAAQSTNAAANQGVSDSSSAQGAVGSIQSQLSNTLSFLDIWNTYSDQASQALGRANVHAQRSQTAGDISKLSMGAFNNSDIIAGKLKSIF